MCTVAAASGAASVRVWHHYVTGMGPRDGATAAGGRSCCLFSRAIDGARGAQFLGALADLVEEPLALLT
jgi:hypothetical protein